MEALLEAGDQMVAQLANMHMQLGHMGYGLQRAIARCRKKE